MKGSDFIFDSVQLLYYKCHTVNFKRVDSYMDSPDRKKSNNKSIKMKMINVLNYKEIDSHPEILSNIKTFINKCNCEEINYPSKLDEWKTFEKK